MKMKLLTYHLSISEDSSTIHLPWKDKSYVSIPKLEFSAPMIATSQEFDNDLEEEDNKLGEWRIFKRKHINTPPLPRRWVMYFDGAHSKTRSRTGIVIISSSEEYLLFSLRLQFTCTNNIPEYEALLLGLEVARSRKIQQLIIIGDFDLIVSQIHGTFDTKDEKLKPYRERIISVIKGFK